MIRRFVEAWEELGWSIKRCSNGYLGRSYKQNELEAEVQDRLLKVMKMAREIESHVAEHSPKV